MLLFTDMFPPLCNRVKIQLCDSDLTSDDVIATHFIQLSQIMDPGGDTEGTLAVPELVISKLSLLSSPLYTHSRLTALLPGLPRVSRYQKGNTNLDFTEARDSEWQ